jgi:hypothetical protein
LALSVGVDFPTNANPGREAWRAHPSRPPITPTGGKDRWARALIFNQSALFNPVCEENTSARDRRPLARRNCPFYRNLGETFAERLQSDNPRTTLADFRISDKRRVEWSVWRK